METDRLREREGGREGGNERKREKEFICSPFYGRACRWAMLGESKPQGPNGRKGEVFAYVGRNQNLKDLKDLKDDRTQLLSFHNLGYPWLELLRSQPFDTIMGLFEADLGSWCACEYGHFLYPFTCPT